MATPSKSSANGRLQIPCRHPDFISKNVNHDFTVLATGCSDVDMPPAVKGRWLGGFTGRPTLLADLFPALRQLCTDKPPRQGSAIRCALICFWRFLDGYELSMKSSGVDVGRVERLHHITAHHLNALLSTAPADTWPAFTGSRARLVRALVRAAFKDKNLPELLLFTSVKVFTRKETPDHRSALGLIRYLKKKVHEIIARWKHCDELAAKGRNLLELFPLGLPSDAYVSEADAHATYRALINRTNNPVITSADLFSAIRSEFSHTPANWPRHGDGHPLQGQFVSKHDLASGLFPTAEDIAVFHLLFLARSAWNPGTAGSIDIASWHAPYDEEREWLFAPKLRSGGSLQWTVASKASPTSCYGLVDALIKRGAMLRSYSREVLNSSSLPDVAERSPWVGVTVSGGFSRIFVVNPYETTTINSRLADFSDSYNLTVDSEYRVDRITSSEFRDLAAAAIYQDSQYSSWVLMILLGHKNIATTRHYGFRRVSYNESFGLLSGLVDDVLGQISVKRKFDITLTRAKLSGMKLSEEDVIRLERARNNRTLDGCGCVDPKNPPIEIDPGNKRNGCEICIQQHRCAASGCPNAVVFSDSMPLLCKRVAELEYIELTTGKVRFESSSDSGDLRVLRATLTQWKSEDVSREIELWRSAIASGTHKVMMFAGQH